MMFMMKLGDEQILAMLLIIIEFMNCFIVSTFQNIKIKLYKTIILPGLCVKHCKCSTTNRTRKYLDLREVK